MVVVSTLVLACLIPALWRLGDEFQRSMRSWIAGTALAVAADLAFFLEFDAAHLPAVLVAITGLGAAEWLHALRLYAGRVHRLRWPYAVVTLGVALVGLLPGYPSQVLGTSTMLALLYGGAAYHAAQIREPERSTGRLLLVAVFAGIALVMVGRLGLFAFGLRSGAPAGFTTAPRALMFIVASTGAILASFSFVLVHEERLRGRLLQWSLTDSLTGIANRRAFLDSFSRALSSGRRRGEPVAVLILDVDHFKRVNDTAGHTAGDAVLRSLARALAEAVRSEDTLARVGGEEFGVVIPGASLASAAAAAERLRETIAARPVEVEGLRFDVTVSVGVASTDEGDVEAATLFARADALLYEAKRRGRNRVMTGSSPGEA
jgi:diguanylate cyclase (GGDEF)-like protein